MDKVQEHSDSQYFRNVNEHNSIARWAVTAIIWELAVTKLGSFEKSTVEVWLASQHVEKSLCLVQERKSAPCIEIPSDLLIIKCLVERQISTNYQTLHCQRNINEYYNIGTCRKEERFMARSREIRHMAGLECRSMWVCWASVTLSGVPVELWDG